MSLTKSELRNLYRRRRGLLTEAEKSAKESLLCRYLLCEPTFQYAERIGIYAPIGTEADITRLCALTKKKWCWPRVLSDVEMDFAAADRDALVSGRFGISAPKLTLPSVLPDLILAPCLSFDRFGYRLGQGGGYYDRYMETHTVPVWIVAFSCQMADILPREKHDAKAQRIVTEQRIWEAESET